MKNKVVTIIGSRGFDDYKKLSIFIRSFINPKYIDLVVSSEDNSINTLSRRFAKDYDVSRLDCEKYDESANVVRDRSVVDKADIIFVFWDGSSRDTLNSINEAKKQYKSIYLHQYKL